MTMALTRASPAQKAKRTSTVDTSIPTRSDGTTGSNGTGGSNGTAGRTARDATGSVSAHVDGLVAAAHDALRAYLALTQEQIDHIVRKA